ncbi:Tetratricopeptide repeat-containing protein [Methylomagnum ishizawai]|uniref:Tetratricopeptide repeat-containing protein n=1 Tax=Methylomagnum ishizawai TaxID=1760988 RepID=A0A1Y6D375_9GAMM|nr:alkaline phosphatase family protein [Methylomagnum ishizawai]SMF97097.1 Tetratricopeptide repeat-containing protein [Methylomagnum ishizawai]
MAPKVLLLGWDAADWKVITPLMDTGQMPNLEKIVGQGVMGNLSTLYPVLSPMLWTSIATGKRAHKHGIHGFSEPDPQTGGIRPVTNLGRKTKALWNILQQNGLRSNVVGWWPSHPAEPISGVMVSNHFQQATAPLDQAWPMRPGTVHPPRLAEALAEFRIHPEELDGDMLRLFVPQAPRIDQHQDRRLYAIAKTLAENAGIHAAATALMQLEPWDFMAVYFDGIDHFCHGFMKYHPPRLDWIKPEDFELYQDVVNSGYRFHDLMLGAYLALAGDDTTVIIVSDHGFHPDHLRPRELPNEPAGPADEHRHFGIIAMRGPDLKRDELLFGASLLDVTPTILALYGLPLGRDMDGKPLLNAFAEPPTVDYLPSWDAVPGEAGLHPPGMQADPVDQAEALKQLVELGYIDPPGADLARAAAQTVKELRYNLARDYQDSQHLPEAMALYRELWDQWPDESRFGVHLLECQLRLDHAAPARATLERLQREKERYAKTALETLQKLGEAWKDKQPADLKEDEQRQLNQWRKQAGVNRHAFAFLQGRVLAAEGDHAAALQAFAQATEVQVHNRPSLFQHQAEALMALRRWNEAETKLRDILAIDPVNAQAQLGLCRVHLSLKRPQAALDSALAAIGLIYHNPLAHCLCAIALRRLGREDEAIAELNTALAQNPVFPAAHRLLAGLYRHRGKLGKASEHRALARAARQRIAAFKAGLGLPEDADVKLDLDLLKTASVAALSTPGALPALDGAIVVVSGLPRSGTSMMMQMLAAGGLPLLTDGERAADANNPRGYLELEAVKRLGRDTDTGWLDAAQGQAVKIVAPLLPHLPMGHSYRIVFMERPLQEIVASQAAMLTKLGKTGGNLSERQLATAYLKQVDQVRTMLAAHPERVRVLAVDYRTALDEPVATAARINRFLGGGLDLAAMAGVVDPALHRQRMA